jgi:hypothetical protein
MSDSKDIDTIVDAGTHYGTYSGIHARAVATRGKYPNVSDCHNNMIKLALSNSICSSNIVNPSSQGCNVIAKNLQTGQ